MCFFFQAEDGIRDLVRSRGLGDVYKRQEEQFRLKDAQPIRGIETGMHSDCAKLALKSERRSTHPRD